MRYTIVNRLDDVSVNASEYINSKLQQNNKVRDNKNPEIVIVIGGDGTFLIAAHKYLDIIDNVLMVGIHTGTLGFFADFKLDEIDYLIDAILNEKPQVNTKRLLKIEVINNDDSIEEYYALNEVRIENIFKTQILEVTINDVYLETFRGTGLCISTQPGSTGYNRSLRGAVISDDLELIQVAEITGIHHRLFQSLQVPLILHPNSTIDLDSPSYDNASLCFDHLSTQIYNAKHVNVTLSKTKKINFARYHEDLTYIHRIRSLF